MMGTCIGRRRGSNSRVWCPARPYRRSRRGSLVRALELASHPILRNGRGGCELIKYKTIFCVFLYYYMRFTGTEEAVCPISQVAVTELLHPVGFDATVAYECDDLVQWLSTRKATNPLTQEEKEGKITDILRPLIVGENTRHLRATCAKLERAGWTKVNLQVLDIRDHFLTTFVQGVLSTMRMKNACSSACMSIHTIVFTVITCLVALHREGIQIMAVEEFDLAVIAATICSLARLVYDTHQNYRQNGAWICFNLIMVNLYSYFCFLA